MEVVRKVPVSEDLYRILVGCESDINDLFFRRFQCTAEVTGPRIAASSAAVKVYEKRLRGGPLISVWKDDLTRQVVDVVVNAANEYLDHIGGLAYALVEAGGQQIVQESKDRIKEKGILVAGEIAVTSGGSLPIKKIIHAVGPRWSPWIAGECRAQLEEAIKQVLVYMRDHTDLRSVAIPAISSGIFGFPLDLCATIIVETIYRFCNNEDRHRLKEIRLVNHDDKTVQAMKAACEEILGRSDPYTSKTSSSHSATLSSHSPVSPSRSVTSSSYSERPRQGHREEPSQMSVSLTISGLNLHLKTGKIEDEKSAVIVNSVSRDLILSSGAISAAIYSKAGYPLQKEILEKRSLSSNNMIPTMGYNLPCRHVYHVILPLGGGWEAEKTLRDVTKQCLMTAHRYGAPSISFPALGTGNIGLQKHKVADIMTQTVFDFARGSQCKMDVYFIIHPSDTDTFKAFQDKLRASGTITDKDMEVSERRTGPEPSAEETCVSIAGERGDEAAAWLQDLFSPAPLLIQDNHLLLFGSKEFDDLASGPPGVDIEEDLRDGRVTLKISGPQPERVTAVIQAERLLLDVQKELAESLEEELLETAVIWCYESKSITHKYSAKAIRELENAYSSQTNITLKASPGHKIDIMKRTAEDSDQTFHIQRRCLWDALRNIQVSLTPGTTLSQTKMVDADSQEFSDRSREFRKAGLVLLKMEKVQNKLLSVVFQCKKDAVEQRLKKPSTETLYQLVPGQFWRTICDVGFHRMYTTPRDTKHGAGIYFKKTLPNIAQRFQSPEKDALYILQAEVVIGAAAKYSRTQPVLPCAGGDALRVCDSLVNGGIPADHYVIFDRFQANPQHVFTCTCNK